MQLLGKFKKILHMGFRATLNVNQGVITAKSFQSTINNWSGLVNLHVPKKNGFLEKNLNVRV